MEFSEIAFLVLLGLVSFLYASVGHGGASGYLALMSLFGYAPEFMKTSALSLNILVSFIAFLNYRRTGQMKWGLFFTLIIASFPAAYLGGSLPVQTNLYKHLLGLFLLFPAFRLLFYSKFSERETKEIQYPLAIALGLGIGFFSGLIGIGGGIILSPILLLLGWSNLKETATISALFITINSIAGMLGSAKVGLDLSSNFMLIVLIALTFGVIGSYLGAQRFKQNTLRYLLATVLLMASIKLIFV